MKKINLIAPLLTAIIFSGCIGSSGDSEVKDSFEAYSGYMQDTSKLSDYSKGTAFLWNKFINLLSKKNVKMMNDRLDQCITFEEKLTSKYGISYHYALLKDEVKYVEKKYYSFASNYSDRVEKTNFYSPVFKIEQDLEKLKQMKKEVIQAKRKDTDLLATVETCKTRMLRSGIYLYLQTARARSMVSEPTYVDSFSVKEIKDIDENTKILSFEADMGIRHMKEHNGIATKHFIIEDEVEFVKENGVWKISRAYFITRTALRLKNDVGEM